MRLTALLLMLPLLLAAAGDAGWYGPDEQSYGAAGLYLQLYDYDLGREVSPEFAGRFLLLGGRVYYAVNDWFRFGLQGGAAFTADGPDDPDVTQQFGLGAFTLEPYLSWEWFYLSAPVAVGFGGYRLQSILERFEEPRRYTVKLFESGFFCVEPAVEVGVKIIPFGALVLRGGYHWHYDGEGGRGAYFFGGGLLFGVP